MIISNYIILIVTNLSIYLIKENIYQFITFIYLSIKSINTNI